MKHFKFRASLMITLLLCTAALAHKPLLSVDDNEDGTIYIEVGFSDGSSGAGHEIIIKDKNGKVLSENKVPEESSLDIDMPSVPYTVTFYAGEGHEVTVDGPYTEAAIQAETEVQPAAEKPNAPTTTAPSTPKTSTPAPSTTYQPVVVTAPAVNNVPNGPGFEMALKMMITNSIVIAVLLAFLLGAFSLWIGYTIGKSKNK